MACQNSSIQYPEIASAPIARSPAQPKGTRQRRTCQPTGASVRVATWTPSAPATPTPVVPSSRWTCGGLSRNSSRPIDTCQATSQKKPENAISMAPSDTRKVAAAQSGHPVTRPAPLAKRRSTPRSPAGRADARTRAAATSAAKARGTTTYHQSVPNCAKLSTRPIGAPLLVSRGTRYGGTASCVTR